MGNVRYSFDYANGFHQSQSDDYYPFGMRIGRGVSSPENKYLYNGKELQDGIGQYDYGARFYDPVIGRLTTIDPKAELYFRITPYAYAANTPVNAIDPDGRLVIFINGNHFGDGGSSRYWREIGKRSNRWDETTYYEKHAFDKDVMRHLGDNHAMYVDGAGNAMKGYHPFSTLLSPGLSGVGAADRRAAVYEEGMANAAAIIESLHRTGGVIDESIKVITHSMGGAYGKEYVQAILDYAKQNNIAGVTIAFEADFAPFQPKQQKAVKGVPTLQFSHDGDMVAGDDQMPGAQKKDTSSDKGQGHSIFDFMNQVKNLPAGKYKRVNGQIVPE